MNKFTFAWLSEIVVILLLLLVRKRTLSSLKIDGSVLAYTVSGKILHSAGLIVTLLFYYLIISDPSIVATNHLISSFLLTGLIYVCIPSGFLWFMLEGLFMKVIYNEDGIWSYSLISGIRLFRWNEIDHLCCRLGNYFVLQDKDNRELSISVEMTGALDYLFYVKEHLSSTTLSKYEYTIDSAREMARHFDTTRYEPPALP